MLTKYINEYKRTRQIRPLINQLLWYSFPTYFDRSRGGVIRSWDKLYKTLKILKDLYKFNKKSNIANWLEGRTIKYTNFRAKYMKSRSKLHWNIHVVLCLVSVTWNNRWYIGILEFHDHAERHCAFNSSSKRILLLFDFYDIDPKHQHQTRLNNEVIDYYNLIFCSSKFFFVITFLFIIRSWPF